MDYEGKMLPCTQAPIAFGLGFKVEVRCYPNTARVKAFDSDASRFVAVFFQRKLVAQGRQRKTQLLMGCLHMRHSPNLFSGVL